MFHLAQNLYGKWTAKEQYNVLILGLDNAGKTTFLEQVKHKCNPNYQMLPSHRILPTMGQNVATVEVNSVKLKFWDVGGQDALRELWQEYYQSAHGVVFVIDSCDGARLIECKDALMHVVSDDRVEGVQVLVVANKSDMEGAIDIVDIKEMVNPLLDHLNARDSRVMPASAATGSGIEQALEWLSVKVVRNKESRPPILV